MSSLYLLSFIVKMDKTMNLPYSKVYSDVNFKNESKYYYKYLKNIFTPYFKKNINSSKYLKITNFIHTKPSQHIDEIMNFKINYNYKKHPKYIYFDIKKFYPTVSHDKLKILVIQHYLRFRWVKKIPSSIDELVSHEKISRYFRYFLNYLDVYFLKTSVKWYGLISSNSVTYVLVEIYLHDLFINIWCWVLRWNDDFVLLFRNTKDISYYIEVIKTYINSLELNINITKFKSGILFTDTFSYIGFEFKKWPLLSIKQEKINEYLTKVKKIFSLVSKSHLKKRIKKLRQLQFWFFYYYRLSFIKKIWEFINTQTRLIVRKYLFSLDNAIINKFFIKNNFIYSLWIIDFLKIS